MCEIMKTDCLHFPVTSERVIYNFVVKMSIIFFMWVDDKGVGDQIEFSHT